MKTLKRLDALESIKWNNATKIKLTNTNNKPIQNGLEIRDRGDIIIEFPLEINKTTTTFFSKYDLRNLKAFSNFYGYWFNEKAKTLSMNGKVYDILKVKNNLYLKDRNTMNIESLNKHFKIAKMLNNIKVFEKIFKANTENLNKL